MQFLIWGVLENTFKSKRAESKSECLEWEEQWKWRAKYFGNDKTKKYAEGRVRGMVGFMGRKKTYIYLIQFTLENWEIAISYCLFAFNFENVLPLGIVREKSLLLVP